MSATLKRDEMVPVAIAPAENPQYQGAMARPTYRRRRRVVLVGICLIIVATAVMWMLHRRGDRDMDRTGYVVSYRVVDDNTAFIVSSSYEHLDGRGWLSRIDASGRTLWLRELPDVSIGEDVLRIGNGVIGVRYTRTEHGVAKDLSMAAFSFDGERLWDRVLVPYHAHAVAGDPSLGPTSPTVTGLLGVSVGDTFAEWTDDESKITLTVLAQRTGRTATSRVVDSMPSGAFVFGDRLVWISDDSARAFADAVDPNTPFALVAHMLDVTTNTEHDLASDGPGCTIGDAYLTVVERGHTKALVSFPDGDLTRPHMVAEPFDPIGDGRGYSVHGCGKYQDTIVFTIHGTRDGEPESRVVLVDAGGAPRRSLSLPRAVMSTLAADLPSRFGDASPLGGSVTRFVPLVLPQFEPVPHDLLATLDLADLTIVSRVVQSSLFGGTLFRHGAQVFVVEDGGPTERRRVTTFDGATGELTGAIQAPMSDGRVLPTHLGPHTIWLVSYREAPLGQPPVAILDARSLKPLHATRISIQNVTSAVKLVTGRRSDR
jgi:hypothetical protein